LPHARAYILNLVILKKKKKKILLNGPFFPFKKSLCMNHTNSSLLFCDVAEVAIIHKTI
jgi:hypothetical protein